MSVTGNITAISRGSLHDGKGIRTVVYLKGCGLRCKWCHNPETFSMEKDIIFNPQKCIHCGRCIDICHKNHIVENDDVVFRRDGCIKCGKCADVCPSGALSVSGKNMTVDEVYHEIVKDIHYYTETGGGVTLSGGECLLQADFAGELLKKCKENGINTLIESAFYVPYENVKKVLPYVDCVYADLKIPEPDKHKEYTGHGNELIIENIRKLSFEFDNIFIRIPLIPGVNDGMDDMKKFKDIISTFGTGIKGVELLKYNYLAESKYNSLGKVYNSFGTTTQTDKDVEILYKQLGNFNN